jgi:ribosomal protein S18 acetylase RimI-like enzyme
MDDVRIREWTKADIPAVRHITWETWIATYAAFVPTEDLRAYFDGHYTEEALAALMEDPANGGFVAAVDAVPAGFVRTHWEEKEERFYVSSLYVLPQFQGKGIGGGLMAASEQKALARGAEAVWLGVMEQNVRTLAWYRKTGFTFVEEAPFTMGLSTINHLIGFKRIGAYQA